MRSFFSAEGGPILIKFCRLVQNDMSTAVIWSKSKPDVELQYGGCLGEFNGMSSQNHLPHYRVLPPGEFNVIIPELCVTLHGAATEQIQWHVILEPHIILQVAATWWIHCHDSRATLQGAVTWRIQCHDHATLQGVRIPSAILKIVLCRILVFFKNEVWALMSGGFRIVSDRLVWKAVDNFLRYRIFYYCGCFFVQNPGIR